MWSGWVCNCVAQTAAGDDLRALERCLHPHERRETDMRVVRVRRNRLAADVMAANDRSAGAETAQHDWLLRQYFEGLPHIAVFVGGLDDLDGPVRTQDASYGISHRV